jgi:hypothetical protein
VHVPAHDRMLQCVSLLLVIATAVRQLAWLGCSCLYAVAKLIGSSSVSHCRCQAHTATALVLCCPVRCACSGRRLVMLSPTAYVSWR